MLARVTYSTKLKFNLGKESVQPVIYNLWSNFQGGEDGGHHVGKCCVLPRDMESIQSQFESSITQ